LDLMTWILAKTKKNKFQALVTTAVKIVLDKTWTY